MAAIDTLANVIGLYAVRADGVLGVYGDGKQFIPDTELSAALAPFIRQLLSAYLAHSDGNKYRIGLVCHPQDSPRPWNTDTFLLEKSVVRELYPVGGPPSKDLTAFQNKNREKSIYRAIELLIEYRHETAPDEAVYCPLLFDNGTSLHDYPPALGFGGTPDKPASVLEVLNLMAAFPMGRRNHPAIAKLMGRMQQYIVKKDKRRDGNLAITDRDYVGTHDNEGADFFDVDKRHDRQGSLLDRLRSAEDLQAAERFDQVERWLERPHRPADAALLRRFSQFRDLDMDRISTLVKKALIYTAPSGVRLLNMGMTDSWNMYLLEGTLSLEAADGGTLLITGGTDKATSPVSFLKPRKYNVSSVTPVSFLWIHDALLAAVLVPPGPPKRIEPALKTTRR